MDERTNAAGLVLHVHAGYRHSCFEVDQIQRAANYTDRLVGDERAPSPEMPQRRG